ncbi:unnamed protein product, partial [Anisakis simplex]|uniref:Transposase n=1 Tax=Anisakis simplex TaxID=6269 RepID=A0A0M3JQ15_ANISI
MKRPPRKRGGYTGKWYGREFHGSDPALDCDLSFFEKVNVRGRVTGSRRK